MKTHIRLTTLVKTLGIAMLALHSSACIANVVNGDSMPDDGQITFRGYGSVAEIDMSVQVKNQVTNGWEELGSADTSANGTTIGETTLYRFAVPVDLSDLTAETHAVPTPEGNRYDFKVVQGGKYTILTFDEGGIECTVEKIQQGKSWIEAGLLCRSEDSPILSLYEGQLYGPDNVWFHAQFGDVPQDLEGTGISVGDIIPNVTLRDQNNDDVELYQFYGKVVLVKLFAEWCGPCKASAPHAEELWQDHQDDGLVVFSVMQSANGHTPPTLASIQAWVQQYNKTHPVVRDVNPAAWIPPDYYPQYYIVDRDMTIAHKGGLNEALLLNLLNN